MEHSGTRLRHKNLVRHEDQRSNSSLVTDPNNCVTETRTCNSAQEYSNTVRNCSALLDMQIQRNNLMKNHLSFEEKVRDNGALRIQRRNALNHPRGKVRTSSVTGHTEGALSEDSHWRKAPLSLLFDHETLANTLSAISQ
jgi:hypothetical protein